MSFLNTILKIVFPVNCLSCGKSGEDLCFQCIGSFPEAERESENWVFPIYDYRHPAVKKTIWLLKYKGKKTLTKVLAQILYARIVEELSDLSKMENFRESVLVPIPLTRARKIERGFNQAELMCKKLMKLDTDNIFRLETKSLIKIKKTEHQARILDRSKRLKNIIGTFGVKRPERIKGKNIILIDDVTTTGATLSEAKKVLKCSGAKKVIAFTIAH